MSCKSYTKNEAFLARYKISCKDFASKICKIIFARFRSNLARKLSCKIVKTCKKSFIFSARLARFSEDLASLARKILARFGYFLQDGFHWEYYCSSKVHQHTLVMFD